MSENPTQNESKPDNSHTEPNNVAQEGGAAFGQSIKSNEEYSSQLELFQNDQSSPLYPMKPFDEIIKGPASNPILHVIDELEFYQPSKIQSQAIPILNGETKQDLIAQAQSGSGKTIAFLVSMLLHVDEKIKAPQTICICHTRELTCQTFKVFTELNKYTKFNGGQVVKNIEEPSRDAQLLFGTAQSLANSIRSGKIDASHVNFLVIDEADTILEFDSTHRPAAMQIITRLLPPNCQYGFFSATFPINVVQFIQKQRNDIISIRLKRSEQHVRTVEHWYTMANNRDQTFEVILDLAKIRAQGQTYIFVPSKNLVSEITEYLVSKNIVCKAFSSDLSAEDRDQTLDDFRNQKFLVLVTTDVLSRGIDIPNTYLVINYGIPRSYNLNKKRYETNVDTYYHRAGRAGRFGRTGLCFSVLMNEREEKEIQYICGKMQLDIKLHKISTSELKNLPEESEIKKEE